MKHASANVAFGFMIATVALVLLCGGTYTVSTIYSSINTIQPTNCTIAETVYYQNFHNNNSSCECVLAIHLTEKVEINNDSDLRHQLVHYFATKKKENENQNGDGNDIHFFKCRDVQGSLKDLCRPVLDCIRASSCFHLKMKTFQCFIGRQSDSIYITLADILRKMFNELLLAMGFIIMSCILLFCALLQCLIKASGERTVNLFTSNEDVSIKEYINSEYKQDFATAPDFTIMKDCERSIDIPIATPINDDLGEYHILPIATTSIN